MIESAEYLENNGFSENQLTLLHHSSLLGKKERYKGLKKYFSTDKNLGNKNSDYVNRVIFVANEHSNKLYPFPELILKALEKWPLSSKPKIIINKSKIKKEEAYNNSGLYIVTLNNIKPISVNDNDSRNSERSIKVTKENCKFGKARDLSVRKKNYISTFGKDNVNYFPIVKVDDIDSIEKTILKKLYEFRIKGRTGIKNEWLHTIQPNEVEKIIIKVLDSEYIKYEKLSTVNENT